MVCSFFFFILRVYKCSTILKLLWLFFSHFNELLIQSDLFVSVSITFNNFSCFCWLSTYRFLIQYSAFGTWTKCYKFIKTSQVYKKCKQKVIRKYSISIMIEVCVCAFHITYYPSFLWVTTTLDVYLLCAFVYTLLLINMFWAFFPKHQMICNLIFMNKCLWDIHYFYNCIIFQTY